MELTDPLDIYAYQLGTVWGRLLSLEMLLRLAISGGNFKDPLDVSVGDEVEIDAINRWAYMSELVRQYNTIVAGDSPESVLASGDEIVLLRNALAHGIAISTAPAPPLRLVKFGKPSAATGPVTVDFAVDMTSEWLERQQRLVQQAIETVVSYVKVKGIGQSHA
jgi:hypothetical protein